MSELNTHKDEYDILRREIDNRMNAIHSYSMVMLTVTATIMGFAINQKHYALCLVPIIVIVPTYIKNRQLDKAICKVGAYLNVYCEGELFNWERRCHKWDKLGNKKNFISRVFSIYNSLVIVCVLVAIYKCINDPESNITILFGVNIKIIRILGVVLVGILAVRVMERNKIDYYTLKKEYIDNWKQIKDEEEKTTNNGSMEAGRINRSVKKRNTAKNGT